MKIGVDFFTGISISKEDMTVFRSRERCRKWRVAHPERKYASSHNWMNNNPEKVQQYRKDNHVRILATIKNCQYKQKYNLTTEDKQRRLEEQEHTCAICKDAIETLRDAHVDHSHETGKVRALLCIDCNRMLGAASDSKEILLSAIAYLEKFSE